mmetsp:Transcript_11269/g.27731  ORF Transcript_11269/g.27731 Transcript_11269/m.27731 type:complete len:557 (-) Transcript_11269:454-2124(-)
MEPIRVRVANGEGNDRKLLVSISSLQRKSPLNSKFCARRPHAPAPGQRRRKLQQGLSSPATPPHSKRQRIHHAPKGPSQPPSLYCESELRTEFSCECDKVLDYPCSRCLAGSMSPREEESIVPPAHRLLLGLWEHGASPSQNPLLASVLQYLSLGDMSRLARCAKRFYFNPLVWKTFCKGLGLKAPSAPSVYLSWSKRGAERWDEKVSWQLTSVNSSGSLFGKKVDGEDLSKAVKEAAYFREAASLRGRELLFVPSSTPIAAWLQKNPCLRSRFFPILVNWLVDLHLEIFRLHASARRTALAPVHTAVKYLYIYLSRVGGCQSQGLQRVGVACYALAIRRAHRENTLRKIEVDDEKFAYFTDNAYTPQEIKATTDDVASAIPHIPPLSPPTALEALEALLFGARSNSKCTKAGEEGNTIKIASDELVVAHAFYMVDLSIHEDTFACDLPSCVAAASLLAAHRIVHEREAAPECDIRALAAACCADVNALNTLSQKLHSLFDRAKRRETRQTLPHRASVTASFYWTVIDRYRRALLALATGVTRPAAQRELRRIRFN